MIAVDLEFDYKNKPDYNERQYKHINLLFETLI